jgi:Rgg/GadR/MutR family transcriptional activator
MPIHSLDSTDPRHQFGRVFQKLRKLKGFTLEEASSSVISVSQLSKFENMHTMLSADTFFKVLDNINSDAFEFQNMYNHFLNSSDNLLFHYEISEAYKSKNVLKLMNMLHQAEKAYLLFPNSRKYKLNEIHLKSVLSHLENSNLLSAAEIGYLTEYFLNLKEWGRHDLLLFAHSLNFLDSKVLINLAKKLINPLQVNDELNHSSRAFMQVLLNLIKFFTMREQYKLANQFIVYFNRLNISEIFMHEKAMFQYVQEIFNFKRDKNPSAIASMEKFRDFFKLCGCYLTAKEMTEEIDTFKKLPVA